MRSSSPALPRVGDVIRYVYLWSHEHDAGREDGSKDRPVTVLAVAVTNEGRGDVFVFPITSTSPTEPGAGLEIPAATRARLGLQAEPCWVLVSEANRFSWPGPDVRPIGSAEGSFIYGTLPESFMRRVKDAFAARLKTQGSRVIRRTE